MTDEWITEALAEEEVFAAVKEQLEEDFANGNLFHTFSPTTVSNQKYVHTFLRCVQSRLNERTPE
jgi:hypothetical protein